ncbi:MAG: hypothetical protein Q4B62_08705 [Clostridiaceae bacterium]|nr:hypothetical protein [Clostridiaceae bacterium]
MNAQEAITILKYERETMRKLKIANCEDYKLAMFAYDMAIDALGNYIGERDTSMPKYISFNDLVNGIMDIPFGEINYEYASRVLNVIASLPNERVVPLDDYRKCDIENEILKAKLRGAEKKKSRFEQWLQKKGLIL